LYTKKQEKKAKKNIIERINVDGEDAGERVGKR